MLSTSVAVTKLLALQVFCLVVILSRLLSSALLRRQLPALKIILGLKLSLLIANPALTIHFGPFSNGDDVPADGSISGQKGLGHDLQLTK